MAKKKPRPKRGAPFITDAQLAQINSLDISDTAKTAKAEQVREINADIKVMLADGGATAMRVVAEMRRNIQKIIGIFPVAGAEANKAAKKPVGPPKPIVWASGGATPTTSDASIEQQAHNGGDLNEMLGKVS